MKKSILIGVVTLFLITVTPAFASGVFPINESFSGSKPADWTIAGNAVWGASVHGDASLQLTDTGGGESGLGFYDVSFPSSLGIVAQFKYYSGDGSGADGISFFLVDGDQVSSTTIHAGTGGAALGYAQNTLAPSDGVPHAYLGVGFDEYGNFVTNGGSSMNGGLASAVPDSVGLRGSGDGTTGYDYLTSADVNSLFSQHIDGGWRTARVTVTPGSGNATIRVEMSWDSGTTWHTVINNYVYNQAPPANFKLGFAGGTGGSTNVHAIGDVSVTLPANLKTTLINGGGATLTRGATTTYSYRVTNTGPNDSATTTVTNTMPIGDTGFSSATWNYTLSTGATSSGTQATLSPLTFPLATGDTATVTVHATVGDHVISTSSLNSTITASPESDKSNPNPAAATVVVNYTTSAPTAAQSNAIDIITAYAASDGTTTAPKLSDYTNAGVTGVSTSSLSTLNSLIANQTASAVDTTSKVQAFADKAAAQALIVAYINSSGTTTAPTTSNYATAGITGVTTSNLSEVNSAVVSGGDTSMTAVQNEVNKVVALDKIKAYATSHGTTAAPTVNDYVLAGVTGVTVYNLSSVNTAIANGNAIGSLSDIQTVVNAVNNPTQKKSSGSMQGSANFFTAIGDVQAVQSLHTQWPQLFSDTSSNTSLQSTIATLKTKLATLLVQYQAMTGHSLTPTSGQSTSSVSTLTVRNLTTGMTGEDVRQLQQVLISANAGPYAAALAHIGATGYFSLATKYALGEFQSAHNILPHAGYFGAITRLAMTQENVAGLWW